MKLFSFLWLFLLLSFISFAQSGNKPKTNPSTQKELEEKLKAAQKQLESLSPEQRKQMEQLGISIPNLNTVPPNTSDKQIAQASGNSYVPSKDVKRIAEISKLNITAASLPSQIKNINDFVLPRLDTETKTIGEKFYSKCKTERKNAVEIGNASVGLWATGNLKMAIYLMARACTEDPLNSNNLNNYASMLSMSGAEQHAIPILNYVNTKHPKNSTILNNLAQAWFGLGDIPIAEKYLDSVIRIYAYHPQANLTKSIIEESRGQKEQAVVSAKKSIKYYYSAEKENNLKKLGYKLKASDVFFAYKPDPDPFRLTNFTLPPTPKSASEEESTAKEWNSYMGGLSTSIANISNEINQLSSPKQKEMIANAQKYMDGKNTATGPAQPYLYRKAAIKLKDLEKNGGVLFRYKKAKNDLNQLIAQIKISKEKYTQELNKLDKKDNSKEGAGGIDCKEAIALQDKYLKDYNSRFDNLLKEFLLQTRLKISEEIYWKQFMQHPDDFEITKRKYQLDWLAALNLSSGRFVASEHRYTYGKDFLSHCLIVEEAKYSSKLANFNDINCPYKDTTSFIFGQTIMNCSVMITKLDVKFLSVSLTQDMNKAGFNESFIGCTVALTGEAGISKWDKGPLRLEAKVGGSLEFEFDRTGLSDVRVSVEAKTGIGNNIIEEAETASGVEQSIWGNDFVNSSKEMGVKGTISLISGHTTLAGTGILAK